MKQKGFTLIELLAVIVILSVIALIVTPVITGIIKVSKMKALEQTLNGIVDSINIKNSTNILKGTKLDGIYEIKDGKTDLDISFKGQLPDNGRISIGDNGEINIVAFDDNFIGIYNNDISHVEEGTHIGIIADNVADLKTKDAESGAIALTYGYYDMKLGGSAIYRILSSTDEAVDDANIIKLNNGLFAKLQVFDETISVSQYGAYGDGVHDDTIPLNKAFASNVKNVNLSKTSYKVTNIIDANVSDKQIKGKESVIFTDNDYSNTREWLFKIDGANNVTVDGIKLETRNSNKPGYKTQFAIRNANNIKVINSSFTIPNTVDISGGKEYTNMDLYTNWHNVTVDNCKFYNVTKASAGGGIWIREMSSDKTSDNLVFTNNYLEKSSHDEILGVFRGKIDKVNISYNNFNSHEDGVSNPTVMVVTLGSESSTQATNINFSYNKLVGEGTMTLIRSNHADTVEIDHNELSFKALTTPNVYGLFNETSERFNLHDNTITLDLSAGTQASVFKGNMDVDHNNITINSSISYFSTEPDSTFTHNTIVYDRVNGELVRNTKNFSFNTVTVNNKDNLKSIVRFYSSPMEHDSIIEGNIFNLKAEIFETNTNFLLLQQMTMGGHTVTIKNNKVQGVTGVANKNFVYFNAINDTTPQTVYISGNDVLPFKYTNGRYNCTADHQVIAK